MRYAFKIFYDGRHFHGSQMQPNVRTVEGEIRKALSDLGITFERLRFASRTDSSVSSLGNCFSFSTDSKLIEPRILNSRLPEDMWILAVKCVDETFDPRYAAKEKIYKYLLPSATLDIGAISGALGTLEGEHSFHNFAVLEGKNPVRRLDRVELSTNKDLAVLTFSAEGFLWQQIRRLVTALVRVGKGDLNVEDLKRHFDPGHEEKIPPSPGENLILWDIKYDFFFELEEYSKNSLATKLLERMDKLSVELEMYSQVLMSFENSR